MIGEINWWIDGVKMRQPGEFSIETEDLDADTYRSVATGNLIDNVVSKNWCKFKFKFFHLSQEETYELMGKLSTNPINAKIECPLYGNFMIETQFRCSRKNLTKLLVDGNFFNVECNLVQKTKVAGQ